MRGTEGRWIADRPDMGPLALAEWRTTRGARLDQLVAAHTAVGGRRRGRRFATDQINAVYLLAVAAQFQGFCRDLHSESATALVAATQPHWAAIWERRSNGDRGGTLRRMADEMRVGDVALIDFPAGYRSVRIVEDRGHLGVGGRRILRVLPLDDGDDVDAAFEMPEELLVRDSPEERERLGLLAAARRRAASRGRPAA